jgi:mono/diheme cytochrome c family protein
MRIGRIGDRSGKVATGRRLSWRSAVIGSLATLALLVAIGAAVVFGGLYPVGASAGHSGAVGWLLHESMERSVKRAAAGLEGPRLSWDAALEGGSHFKGMCQQCHGGPGVQPDAFAEAMTPNPPDLSRAAGEWSRPEIFWIAKYGIKMTGMPAFGQQAPDDELWKIAAFVEQLPKVGAEQYESLPDAHADGGHAHDEADEGNGAGGHSH